MVKTLQMVGVFALVFAGVVLLFWVAECRQSSQSAEQEPEMSIAEKYRLSGGCGDTNEQSMASPLLQQAEAFALYLNPPALSVESQTAPLPEKRRVAIERPEIKPVELSPQFELQGISYYRSKPEESMALIWEPGSGYRWIKQGAKLGHFVLEQVQSTSILYRDSQRTHEMAFVPGQITTRVAQDQDSNPTPKVAVEPETTTLRPIPPGNLRRTPPTRVAAKSAPD